MGMFRVSKRMEIAGSHKLNLPYESKCQNIHGHNWIVTVHLESKDLTEWGMIADFAKLKEVIHGQLDHSYINDKLPDNMNPTAENMARWIMDVVNQNTPKGHCYKVTVQESEGNIAEYSETREEWLQGRVIYC